LPDARRVVEVIEAASPTVLSHQQVDITINLYLTVRVEG
jgi:hypothetical protein